MLEFKNAYAGISYMCATIFFFRNNNHWTLNLNFHLNLNVENVEKFIPFTGHVLCRVNNDIHMFLNGVIVKKWKHDLSHMVISLGKIVSYSCLEHNYTYIRGIFVWCRVLNVLLSKSQGPEQ